MPQQPEDRYLYEKIYTELKEEILSGKYRKGDWFPPERVLKDRFGTTHLTVRNALAKLVLEGYIERYSGKGTLVIYARERPAPARRTLRFPYAHVILGAMDEGNAAFLESLEEQMRRIPLPLRLSCHHGDVLLERNLHAQAAENGALAILEPVASEDSVIGAETRLRNTIIVRAVDPRVRCPQVILDSEAAARETLRYLRDLGHVVVAMVAVEPSREAEALREAFEKQGDAGVMIQGCAAGMDAATSAVRRLIARRADCRAFLCSSDETAVGVMRGLQQAGLAPGRESSVIGCGNTALARGFGLTSIDPGFARMGRLVMTPVAEAMSRGELPAEVFLVAPELRIRESCAPAAHS